MLVEYYRWINIRLFLFFLIFFLSVINLQANPRPEFINALWVAQEHNLLKISSMTGQSLFQTKIKGQVQAIGVDKPRARVWGVTEQTLHAFDFSGNIQEQFSLASVLTVKETPHQAHHEDHHKKHHRNKYKELQLKVDEDDGSLWLYHRKTLWHVTAKGELLQRFSIKHEIKNIALIPTAGHVWLASKKSIHAFNIASGQLISQSKKLSKSKIKDIAYDASLNEVCVAGKKGLSRFSLDGQEIYQRDFHHLEAIQPDGKGKLWFATEETLFYLDSSGSIQFQLHPFAGEHDNEIEKLVLVPTDQSIWVAAEHTIVHVDKNGVVLQRIQLKSEIEDAALYSDLIAPLLSFILPVEGSVLNTAIPTLTLQHSDNGIGIDNNTLSFEQDGLDLAVNCLHAEATSACTPLMPLAEGFINLSATVKDYVGNTSEKAITSFTVDTIPPEITVNSHWNGAFVNQSAQALSGSLSEFATLHINNSPVTLGLNHSFAYPVLLLEGQNNFLFKAQDEGTNESVLPFILFLDTVPPAKADTGKISLSDVVKDITLLTGEAGSVEGNSKVEVTNITTNTTEHVQANTDGSFTLSIQASPNDILQIIVIDKATNQSVKAEVKVPLPLSIEITSPANGAVIDGDSVNIEGVIKGPMNSGITVNGVSANVSPEGKFILNAFELNKGDNTLEIVLSTLTGESVAKIITVTSDGQTQPFKFEPGFNSGPAPFNVELEFVWYSNEVITQIDVDYEGDDIIDFTTDVEQEVFSTTFSEPGIYRPTITITTENTTYKKQTVILVQSRESMIQMLTAIWDGMNQALVQGDITTALTYLDDFGKKQYGPVFEVLKDKMPQIVQSYSIPKGVLITGNIGELAVNRDYKGQNRIYFIYFMRGKDGVWKLHNM